MMEIEQQYVVHNNHYPNDFLVLLVNQRANENSRCITIYFEFNQVNKLQIHFNAPTFNPQTIQNNYNSSLRKTSYMLR